mmetsp:Transcript_12508/g.20806  ORF Transcript_12508/g.20806 Transcript_12508/m.20806 type:complete len:443 (+) Transcript_12508:173-1501(+)|eukprot:CAMPEP_0119023952 /NCGR_PEP_ID=MMETSP1176-20130426/30968_1 /TAXON_ID=265551 /ORGANISM="Synedropsis recta cf, Strain CCMP1620" /LENGTH=442 /DNA_ID=CAMNT_0006979123 /DNA_START=63 /DNA_END=1391 /DNA_ORIENTATION=+
MFLPSALRSVVVLLGFALILPDCDATIKVYDYAENIEFDSLPAVFGMPWIDNVDYRAHLQFLDSRPFLCHDDIDMLGLSQPEDASNRATRRFLNNNKRNKTHTSTPHIVADDLPVAVLVSRGACSFEEKAREALLLPNVEYCIIYDDRARSHLVPMSASEPDYLSVGMLFVSYGTGVQLRQMLLEQSKNSTDGGGLVIAMDNRIPDYDGYHGDGSSDAEQWVKAFMSAFFAFLFCVGCLLVCIQAGLLPADTASILGGERLMTEEQVLTLPCVHYGSGNHNHAEDGEGNDNFENAESPPQKNQQTSCAICIEEYGEGDKLRQLPCHHEFHTECILPWLTERHSSCPLCKLHVVSPPPNGEDGDAIHWSHWWRWSEVSWGSWQQQLLQGRTLVSGDEHDDVDDEGTHFEGEQISALEEEGATEEGEVFMDEPENSTEEADQNV